MVSSATPVTHARHFDGLSLPPPCSWLRCLCYMYLLLPARPLPCLARTSTTQVHVDWPHDRPLPFSISVEVTNDSDFKVKRNHRFRFDGGARHQKAVGFFFEVCFRHTHFPTSIPLMLSYLIDLRLWSRYQPRAGRERRFFLHSLP